MQASRAHAPALACVFALLAGCNLTQKGRAPEPSTLNYPIAVAVSRQTVEIDGGARAPKYLFVVNSNFDLRYNTGSLQAIDLGALELAIEQECRPMGGADCLIPLPYPPPDVATEGASVVAAEVGIGSHADGISVSPDGDRIYLPVRSQRALVFVDFLEDGGPRFSCDEEFDEGDGIPRCGDGSVAGSDAVASERELVLDGDPVAVASGRLEDIAVDAAGDFVLVALRAGRVALYIDDETGPPRLVHVAEGFPDRLITLTMRPGAGIGWLTSEDTDQLGRVGITVDERNPSRSFLYNAGAITVGGIDDGEDLRDLQFDPRDATQMYVLSRRPEAVVKVGLDGRSVRSLAPEEVYEIGAGPSRLLPIELGGRTFVLASSFDAQKLFVIDAELGLVSVLGGFSGPFELAYDAGRQWLYLTDFTTSQIRVIDVAPILDNQPPRLVATLGEVVVAGSLID